MAVRGIVTQCSTRGVTMTLGLTICRGGEILEKLGPWHVREALEVLNLRPQDAQQVENVPILPILEIVEHFGAAKTKYSIAELWSVAGERP